MMKNMVALPLVAMLGIVGCGGGSSSRSSGGSNTLFVAVRATVPSFTATVSTGVAKTDIGESSAPLISDMAMNVAFQLLRSYTYPDDEGKIDMSNIYKVLYEAGRYLDEAPERCSPISAVADGAISPFQFSDFLGQTYDCGGTMAESGGYGSSVAYRVSGDQKYLLASYKWAPESDQQIAIGVIEAAYDVATQDVSLIFAQAVDYPAGSSMGGETGSGFATRARITGNAGTHAFELKMLAQYVSLVGKGVSQGAGNYFLFRNGNDYYCLPAGATESDLAAIASTDLDHVSANCDSYKTAVSSAVPYDPSTDLPKIDLSDFDQGVGGTPVHYLMF
jgi:hypothetical protein